MCGYVRVPEVVGVAGRELLPAASVSAGVAAAEVAVKLKAALVSDSEADPPEVSFLAAGLCICDTSGQEPFEPGAAEAPPWLCRAARVGVGETGGLV